MSTLVLISVLCLPRSAWPQDDGLSQRTLEFEGTTRHYFVGLPPEFDPEQTYWPLVVVHGGRGNAQKNLKALAMYRIANHENLPVIFILPEFITKDKQVSRFPALGEDAFLKAVLKNASSEFQLRDKMLLTGYSMGGQFSHRFALAHPDLVQACAPFAAGTWSTPDGRLLIESYGEVAQAEQFLSSPENAAKVPERLHNLFDVRTANVAGLPAAAGANRVPFLVMCGTLDPRYGISLEFAASLRAAGFSVETEWPRTPHGSDTPEYASEFEKYPQHAMQFFARQIRSQSGGPTD